VSACPGSYPFVTIEVKQFCSDSQLKHNVWRIPIPPLK
jgi:hypothetical protein